MASENLWVTDSEVRESPVYNSYSALALLLMQRKAALTTGGQYCRRRNYSAAFDFELLAGSTQFVIPPVRATKRVIVNCGAQSMSTPLKLPVTVADWKPAKEASSRWIPLPPLPVIVAP